MAPEPTPEHQRASGHGLLHANDWSNSTGARRAAHMSAPNRLRATRSPHDAYRQIVSRFATAPGMVLFPAPQATTHEGPGVPTQGNKLKVRGTS